MPFKVSLKVELLVPLKLLKSVFKLTAQKKRDFLETFGRTGPTGLSICPSACGPQIVNDKFKHFCLPNWDQGEGGG